MDLIPAIDLRGGRCVRLYQGDYARETVYGDDPVATALHWRGLGASRLHVVDLDGARTGEQMNAAAVRAIVHALDVPVQLGGGVRDLAAVERWLGEGIERVFLGTAAVESPTLLAMACSAFPGRVGVSADARDGRIAVRGWEAGTGEPVGAFVRRAAAAGVAAVVYTDIARDGTLLGPDLDGVRRLVADLPAGPRFVVAGGVGSLDHVLALARIEGVDAVILGRALYEGRVGLREALAALGGA